MKISGEFFGGKFYLKATTTTSVIATARTIAPPKSYFTLNNHCGGEEQMASMVLNDLYGLKRPWGLMVRKFFLL